VSAVTICAHCALKAALKGQTPEPFAEGPDEHLARVHPDPEQTMRERDDLQRQFDERQALARAARFN
jgi:hypothetical protein